MKPTEPMPVRVDDEKGSFTEAVFGPVDPVKARNLAFGLEVRQEGKSQFPIVCERDVAPGAVDRNAQQFGVETVKLGKELVVERSLIATDRAPVGRVKHQYHGAAAKLVQ